VEADKKLKEAYDRARSALDLWNMDWDENAKAKWKVASIALVRRIATLMKGSVTQVHFLQGGTAVSGEATAFISWNKYPRMAYIHLSADFPSYIRSVTDENDYTGGRNFEIRLDEGLDSLVRYLTSFIESGMSQ